MKFWHWGLILLLTIGGCSILGFTFLNEPLPEGKAGPEADALAQKVLQATGYEHWKETGAASWNFRGSHEYLWDVRRNFARIGWKDNVVLMDLSTRQGVVYFDGEKLEDGSKQLEKAWSMWCNDSFWFMAHHKLFDPGTVRKIVKMEDGSEALLITYMEGGVTPGDSYLWLLNEDHIPTGWKMWVKIFPVGGVYFSWEKWKQLPTGIWIAEEHNSEVAGVPIMEARAAAELEQLTEGVDVFETLESSVTLPQNR